MEKLVGGKIFRIALLALLMVFPGCGQRAEQGAQPARIGLSESHLEAVGSLGPIIVYFDANYAITSSYHQFASIEAFLKNLFTFTDDPQIRINNIHWFLPLFDFPADAASWIGKVDPEIDIVRRIYAQTQQRQVGCFYVHRMNGGTHETEMKRRHPEWCFTTPWTYEGEPGHWNFAYPEVRQYIADKLVAGAQQHDLDGMELDFVRGFVFPPGQQWSQRHKLTQFVRDLRVRLLAIERKRNRPFLLSVRIPENPMGCHYDGLDVETWVGEQLVDILVPGCRSFEVDLAAFRRMTVGTPVRIYPALDDHHSSDGYCTPPIEVFRGVVSNWRRQGADGLQAFNFAYAPFEHRPWWRLHRQFYWDVSRPEGLDGLDKTFVLQRHGGGHGPLVHADPEDWTIPRHGYANSNMLSPLPAPLDPSGRTDLLLRLFVGDDLQAQEIESLSLWVLLHDPNLGEYLEIPRFDDPPPTGPQQLQRAVIRDWYIPERKGKENQNFLYNTPARIEVEEVLEARINNLRPGTAQIHEGWIVFPVETQQLAIGDNLIGIRISRRLENAPQGLSVEKLELRVKYHKSEPRS